MAFRRRTDSYETDIYSLITPVSPGESYDYLWLARNAKDKKWMKKEVDESKCTRHVMFKQKGAFHHIIASTGEIKYLKFLSFFESRVSSVPFLRWQLSTEFKLTAQKRAQTSRLSFGNFKSNCMELSSCNSRSRRTFDCCSAFDKNLTRRRVSRTFRSFYRRFESSRMITWSTSLSDTYGTSSWSAETSRSGSSALAWLRCVPFCFCA